LIDKLRKWILYAEGANDQYEIFWCKFLEDFCNWLRTLKGKNHSGGLTSAHYSWTSLDLILLQQLYNNLTRAVDFWVKTTMEGYIVEFSAENYQSFSKAEAMFGFKLRGRLMMEVPLWIKMFMVEEGLLPSPKTEMVA